MMRRFTMTLILLAICGCASLPREVFYPVGLPEARTIDYRDPASYPAAPIPANLPPYTVANMPPKSAEWQLSLDDAIRVALENAKAVRVLAGTTAVASGKTIYDAAITQTTIDQAQARFDPALSWNNQWSRPNVPLTTVDPNDFTRSIFFSNATDTYLSTAGLTKTNLLGGQAGLTWIENPTRFPGGGSLTSPFVTGLGVPLNPETSRSLALTYTQPLLQGAGFRVNNAPIVIARLNTEISFFQYKDSVQEMVRGVAEAYWNLVQARIDLWAKNKQVEVSEFNYNLAQAKLDVGLGDAKDVAQSKVTYQQFVAARIAAEANVLTREGALRNILGLPPNDDRHIVPVSPPTKDRLSVEWDKLVQLAAERRPDIVELKIIIEAEQQRLIQAQDQTLPKLDASAQYRWNGLTGIMPNGDRLTASGSKFTDWTLGINFSVPLGLRQGRAQIRQERLLIDKDRANLDQGLHAAIHELASTVRDLESTYKQYLAYRETRIAADVNVKVQNANYRADRNIYLNVLQALNDWGAAVSSEAASLLAYNVALATLERQTGTILETHGLVFQEERFRAAGPLLLPSLNRIYPFALVPVGAPQLYPGKGVPAEHFFDLREPVPRDLKSAVQFLTPFTVEASPLSFTR
jgi:outer membrane protein TolC